MEKKPRLSYRTLCEILLNPDLFDLNLILKEFPEKNWGFFKYFQSIVDSGFVEVPDSLILTRRSGGYIDKIQIKGFDDFEYVAEYYMHIPGAGIDEPKYINSRDQLNRDKYGI